METKIETIDALLPKSIETLQSAATICTGQKKGNGVNLIALLEFSNHCRCNCQYCGLRRDNTNLKRYRMSVEDILKMAEYAKNVGFNTICLQSGEDSRYSCEDICSIVSKISDMGMKVILSLGHRGAHEYREFKDAGAFGYLMRFETSNPELYAKLHPKQKLKDRLHDITVLKRLGFYLATGFLVGLPEQTLEDVEKDLAFLGEIGPDFIGIGPFIPHPDTPLANVKTDTPAGQLEIMLRLLAISRIMYSKRDIAATTSIMKLAKKDEFAPLRFGANVILPSITPDVLRKDYEIFAGKAQSGATAKDVEALREKLKANGYNPIFV